LYELYADGYHRLLGHAKQVALPFTKYIIKKLLLYMFSSSVLSIIWDVSPGIFTIELFKTAFSINWYSVLFAFSFVAGRQLMLYMFKSDGKPVSDVEVLTMYAVIATVIGARFGHYLFYEWKLLFSQPLIWLGSMLTPPFQGLASHGATITIPLALYLYSRRSKEQSFFWVIDRVVIPVALGGAFIRLGNLLNSEIYGVPTNLPWGFVFVRETDPDLLPLVPRHPTQLYEAFFCLFLLNITFYLWKYKRYVLPEGFVTGVFIILLFSFRFTVEFIKRTTGRI
jgi:phosphatidylglycerol---prolipoprotein diacylglyceryl transferase